MQSYDRISHTRLCRLAEESNVLDTLGASSGQTRTLAGLECGGGFESKKRTDFSSSKRHIGPPPAGKFTEAQLNAVFTTEARNGTLESPFGGAHRRIFESLRISVCVIRCVAIR